MKEMENRNGAQGAPKGKTNPGKATILALGKAFPPQLVLQDYLVDGYFKDTSCDDIDLKQKLTRLCNFNLSLFLLLFGWLKQKSIWYFIDLKELGH